MNEVESAGALSPCPRCGHERFTLVDGYFLEHLQKQLRNVVISGDNRFASIALTCDRCGFIAQHALGVLQRHA
jgi:ribosomal protein S27AE